MASGTGGYNAAAYGDNGWNDGALITESGIAADLCANLTLGGYSDWFLPSKDELSQMYFNLHQQGLGGFSNFYYWSSSEAAYNNAWVRRFANGTLDVANKNLTTLYVRAVRAF